MSFFFFLLLLVIINNYYNILNFIVYKLCNNKLIIYIQMLAIPYV